MSLQDIEQQIQALQQQAESLRLDDHNQPAAWRKRDRAGWYRYLQLPPHQQELFKADGWEPLHRRQQAMADAQARALARAHKGVELVRATEAHHAIH